MKVDHGPWYDNTIFDDELDDVYLEVEDDEGDLIEDELVVGD